MFNRHPAHVKLYNCPMDTSTAAFVSATGLTGATEINAINDLVVRLKKYGLWSKMKAIYPFVSDTNNQLSYTTDLSNAYWTKTAVTLTQNAGTAPDGTNTANKIIETTATSGHWVKAIFNITASTTYTMSAYFKASGRNYVALIDDDSGVHTAYFNLSNGTLVSQSGFTSTSITSVGNGWYRCTATRNSISTLSNFYWAISSDGTTYNYTGDGVNGVYIWGQQWEYNASATTYQPIATTPANRFVSQFKYNLKDPRDLDAAFRLAFNGTWAYSKQGATPNGVNGYANTYFLESANATLNSGHISYYSRTNIAGNPFMGASNGTTETNIYPNNGGTFYPRVQATNSGVASTNFDTAAYFIASRITSTEVVGYRNTSRYAIANATVSLNNLRTYYLGANNDGTVRYNSNQVAFSTIGDGLTDLEAANLYTCVQIYQQDLSRAVGTPIVKVSDLDAQAFVSATQIQNSLQATAVNNLVLGLKSASLWSKMKAVYPFISDNINQFGYTEDFTYNAMWSQVRCAMASNATTAPDGTMTADSFTTTSTTIECQLRASISSPYNNVTQTTSVYAKKSTANYFRIRNLSSGGNAWFNLTNGTIGTIQGGQTATMTSVGNGWYRCTLTGTKGVSATDLYDIGFTDTDGTNYPTASVVGYLWGAQLELGSTATTYIPVASTVANKFVQQFKYNLVSPLDADSSYRLAFNGGWTYSLQGALPNGANAYADTKLIPNSHLSIESNHMSFYSRTQANTYAIEMGCEAVTAKDLILYHGFLARKTIVDGAFGTNEASSNITNTLGYQIGSRTSLSNLKLYWNNSLLATNTATKTDGQNSISIIIGATNKTTIGGYSSKQAAFSTIGDGLNDSEASTLYTLVQNFQTTLGRQV